MGYKHKDATISMTKMANDTRMHKIILFRIYIRRSPSSVPRRATKPFSSSKLAALSFDSLDMSIVESCKEFKS